MSSTSWSSASVQCLSHDELVAELALMEQMQVVERLKMAKKRRAQQLKAYYQREKQLARLSSANEQQQQRQQRRSTTSAAPAARSRHSSSSSNDAKTRKSPIAALNELIGVGSGGFMAADKTVPAASRKSSSSKTVSSSSAVNNRQSRLKFVDSVLLLDATIRNDISEVKNLLDSGIHPDSATHDGLTALHQCCIDNLEEMARLLIQSGASVNSRDSELWTPLHAAATCGHMRICRYLCESGADLLAVNSDGNMPYDLCEDVSTLDYIESEMAKRGITQEQIDETRMVPENEMLSDMKKIAENGGTLLYRGPNGETPLHVAACCGYQTVAEFLINQQVPVDVLDNDDWQPIHCAACWVQLGMVELLVEYGASFDSRTRDGKAVLDLCEDIETKQRIVELMNVVSSRRAIRSARQNQHGASSQRRNSSVRRGSAATIAAPCRRRSSIHENNAGLLAKVKDARQEAIEAMRHRQTVASFDEKEDDDDDGDDRVLDAVTVTPAQIQQLKIAVTVDNERREVQTSSLTSSSTAKPVLPGAATSPSRETNGTSFSTPVTTVTAMQSPITAVTDCDEDLTTEPSTSSSMSRHYIESTSFSDSGTETQLPSDRTSSDIAASFSERQSSQKLPEQSTSSSVVIVNVNDVTVGGELNDRLLDANGQQSAATMTLHELKKLRSKRLQQQISEHNNGSVGPTILPSTGNGSIENASKTGKQENGGNGSLVRQKATGDTYLTDEHRDNDDVRADKVTPRRLSSDKQDQNCCVIS